MQTKKNISIIGLGLIGGSLGLSLKKSPLVGSVTGCDLNPEHERIALERSIVDQVKPFDEAVKCADVIIVAIPVDKSIEVIKKVLDILPENATVIDVGSTKSKITQAIAKHPNHARFIPTHPMAGTEETGPDGALGNLFENRKIIVLPYADTPQEKTDEIRALYESIGAQVIFMDAEQHDISVAYVSHISHISSFALALTVLNKERDEQKITDLAAGGFDSTARLAKSGAEMWEPIFLQNKDAVLDVIDEYIENMILFKHAIKSQNGEVIRTLIRQANKVREVLDKNKKTK